MAIGEVYNIKVYQLFQSIEQGLNTFTYRQTSGGLTNAAEDILDEFKADVWAAVRSCQIINAHTYRIQVVNIARPEDSIDSPEDLDGTLSYTGGVLMPYYCLAVRRMQTQPGQKNSYHHFAQQGGSQLAAGQPSWSGDYRTTIVNMIDNLGSLVESGSAAYEPVQIQSGWSYGDTPVVNRVLMGQWQYNVYPTTLNTRKDGFYDWQHTA